MGSLLCILLTPCESSTGCRGSPGSVFCLFLCNSTKLHTYSNFQVQLKAAPPPVFSCLRPWWIWVFWRNSYPMVKLREARERKPETSSCSPHIFVWCTVSYAPEWRILRQLRECADGSSHEREWNFLPELAEPALSGTLSVQLRQGLFDPSVSLLGTINHLIGVYNLLHLHFV